MCLKSLLLVKIGMVKDPAWADPVLLPTFQENSSSKRFWDKVWKKEDMKKLIMFLKDEVLKALLELQSS